MHSRNARRRLRQLRLLNPPEKTKTKHFIFSFFNEGTRWWFVVFVGSGVVFDEADFVAVIIPRIGRSFIDHCAVDIVDEEASSNEDVREVDEISACWKRKSAYPNRLLILGYRAQDCVSLAPINRLNFYRYVVLQPIRHQPSKVRR
jgi:hypothetical protein